MSAPRYCGTSITITNEGLSLYCQQTRDHVGDHVVRYAGRYYAFLDGPQCSAVHRQARCMERQHPGGAHTCFHFDTGLTTVWVTEGRVEWSPSYDSFYDQVVRGQRGVHPMPDFIPADPAQPRPRTRAERKNRRSR